jgi:hypothetical protein
MIGHVEILKIKEPAGLAGNEENRSAAVTVDLELHIPVQICAVVLEILNVHILSPNDL